MRGSFLNLALKVFDFLRGMGALFLVAAFDLERAER